MQADGGDTIAPPESDPEILADRAAALLEEDAAECSQLAQAAVSTARAARNDSVLARALYLAGASARRQANYPLAREALVEARGLYLRRGEEERELEVLLELNRVHRALGEWAAAGEALNRALALSRLHSRRDAEAVALNGLAAISHTLGSHDQAVECLEASLAIRTDLGDEAGQTECLNNLGVVKTMKGDYPGALASLLACHALIERAGGPEAEANCLVNIGNLYQEMGQHAQALANYQRAYGIAHTASLKRLEVIALSNLAETRVLAGDHREAIRLFGEVLVASRAMQYRETEIDALEGLARANIKRGRPREAVEAVKQALEISRACGDRSREVRLLLDLAETRDALRDCEGSLQALEEAAEIAAADGARKLLRECEERLSQHHEAGGDHERSLTHYKAAHRLERELFNEEGERRLSSLATQFDLVNARREAEAYRLRTEEAQRANETLETKVRERTEELENAQIETVMRLALAAEYRDDSTGQHTYRVGHLSAQLARSIGMAPEDVELVRVAARLHDVGKIGISDLILLKPGKLDAEEYERMKEHTTIGAQILSGGRSPILRLAEEIALNHHERWDGKGYPRGLSDEQIPLVGRVVAVADVYDALVTERPYKRAWSQEEALLEIERQSGLMFDPALAMALRGVLATAQAAEGEQTTPEAASSEPGSADNEQAHAFLDDLDRALEEAWNLRGSDPARCRAITEANLALAVAQAYRRGIGYARRNLAYCQYLDGHHAQAIDELLDGLEVGRDLNDHVLTRDCLNWLGAAHSALGDYAAAIDYVGRALTLSRHAGDDLGTAACITNLGLLHHYLEQYEQAVACHRESVEISERTGDAGRRAAALNNLGISLAALGQHEDALDTFTQALPLAERCGDRNLHARLLVNLSETQSNLGLGEVAARTNAKALSMADAPGAGEVHGQALLNQGVLLLRAGKPAEAAATLQDALAFANTTGARSLASAIHRHLASAERALGSLETAIDHLERHHELERAVHAEEAERRLRATTAQREIERARAEAEIHRLRNVELARALASLQEADRLKSELLAELRQRSSDLERHATIDPLTGLLNRSYFQTRLAEEFERARRGEQPLTAAIVDVTDLRGINERCSRQVGDKVLLEVATIIRANCRRSDVVARYDSSQFVLALPGTSGSVALSVCERIRSAVARHDWTRLHPALRVSVSVGLAEGPLPADCDRLLASADERLARAKRATDRPTA